MRTQPSEFQRRMMSAARGAQVRGPGTSTSDSIPARLSDGEFVLPADTVRQVGIKSLRDLVSLTHKPTGRTPHPARFADGGLVDAEKSKRPISFGDVAAAASTTGVTQVPTSRGPDLVSQIPTESEHKAPAADGSLSGWRNTEIGRNLNNAAMAMPGVAGAVPAIAKTGGAISSGLSAAQRLMGLSAAAAGATAGVANAQTAADPASPAAPTPSASASSTPTDQLLVASPATMPSAKPGNGNLDGLGGYRTGGGDITKTVDANGRVTYSGSNIGPNATINGKEAGGGYMTVAPDTGPSQATSAALSGALADAMARGDTGAVQQHYFNRGQSFGGKTEQQVRADNLMTRAQNLLNRGNVGDAQRAQMLLTTLGTLEENANRLLSVQGANAYQQGKLGLDARSQTETERTGALDRQRTAQALDSDTQVAELRRMLLDPNATPDQKKQAQASLLALQGKSAQGEWGIQVTPTTKNADGSTSDGSVYRFNKQTGEVARVDGGQNASHPTVTTPQELARLPSGATFLDASGVLRKKN